MFYTCLHLRHPRSLRFTGRVSLRRYSVPGAGEGTTGQDLEGVDVLLQGDGTRGVSHEPLVCRLDVSFHIGRITRVPDGPVEVVTPVYDRHLSGSRRARVTDPIPRGT